MSDILSSEIVPTLKVDKSNSSSKVKSSETKKGGSSLFDSILAKTKKKIESNDKTTPSKETETEVKSKNNIVSNTTQSKDLITNKISLLDRMVKDIKTDNSSEKKQSLKSKTTIIPKIETIEKKDNHKISLLDQIINKVTIEKTTIKNSETKKEKIISKDEIKTKIIISKEKVETEEIVPKDVKKKEKVTTLTEIKKEQTSPKIDIKNTKNKEIGIKPILKDNIKPQKDQEVIVETKEIIQKTNKIEIKKETIENPTSNTKNKTSNHSLNQNSKKLKDNDKFLDTTLIKSEEKNSLLENMITSIKEDMKDDKKVKKQTTKVEINPSKMVDTVEIIETKIDKKGKVSLLDSLLNQIQEDDKSTKDIKSDTNTKNIQAKEKQVPSSSSPLSATIFLSNQKTQKEVISKQNLAQAKEILAKEPKITKNIQKSADILELNSSEIKITEEDIVKSTDTTISLKTKTNIKEQLNQQNNMLNKIFLNKNKSDESITLLKEIDIKNKKTIGEVSNTKEKIAETKEDVKIVVEQTVVQSISTKIIESKQKMRSFMSDVARNIYLNYKPPVTSFRIKLDPMNLGSIAIMLKSNKTDNSITVSLNMSSNNTLDTFNENRNLLQSALNKTFNQDTNFSLNFGMQNNDSANSFEQFNQQQNNETLNNNVSDENIPTEDEEETIIDQSYM